MIKLHESRFDEIPLFVEMETADDTAGFIFGWNETRHLEEMRKDEVIYLSILRDGNIAGFFILAVEPDGKTVEFRRIVVSKKGKGIGQEAIAAMENYCRSELGLTRIWLDVVDFNARGIHIYEKLAYERFKTGEQEGKRLIYFRKNL